MLRSFRGLEESIERGEGKGWVDLWEFWLLPVVSGLIGLGSNWLLVKLTFEPYHYKGSNWKRWDQKPLGLVGWQGVVPAKSRAIAQDVCLLVDRLITMRDILKRIDHAKMGELTKLRFHEIISHRVDVLLSTYVAEPEKNSGWKLATRIVHEKVVQMVLDELPIVVSQFTADLIDRIEEIYDVRHMFETYMEQHPEEWVPVLEAAAATGISLVLRIGFALGLLVGLVQGVLLEVFVTEQDMVYALLPVLGFVTALLCVSFPFLVLSHPGQVVDAWGRVMCIRDLTIQQQRASAADFASEALVQFLSSESLWTHLSTGPNAQAFDELLRSHVHRFADKFLGFGKPLLVKFVEEDKFVRLRTSVEELAVQKIENILKAMLDHTNEAFALQLEIREGLEALPVEEFDSLIHSILHEDRAKLVFLSALIGPLCGALLALAVFLFIL